MTSKQKRRRAPSLYALIGVIALTAVGIGLFVWGPINPNVSVNTSEHHASAGDWMSAMFGVGGSFGTGQSVGPDGRAQSDLVLTNQSFASVELLSVRATSLGNRTSQSVVPTIVATSGVPATLRHSTPHRVSVTVDARNACFAHHGGTVRYQLLIEARTASGVHRSIGSDGSQSVTCTPDALPAAGPGPRNAAAARTEIGRAFATAYDFTASSSARRISVDDPTGLDAAVTQVASGLYRDLALSTEPRIIKIVFTAPTRAAVLYDLSGVPVSMGAGRIGHVRLVDGRWKITRGTVCADLALAGVHCPPR